MEIFKDFCHAHGLSVSVYNDMAAFGRDKKIVVVGPEKKGLPFPPHQYTISIPQEEWDSFDASFDRDLITLVIDEFGLGKEEKPQVKEVKYKIIACDFDGTLCENKWPEIGEPNLEVMDYLKQEKSARGVKLILWTCRTGRLLKDAIAWCTEQGLEFDTVNENIPENAKEFGADSRKVFAHEYIDDHNSQRFQLPFVTTLT